MTALRKNAVGPIASNSFGATMNPTPRPASVAPSKRAAALPRRTSLPAVASAMNPRIDGTLAAVSPVLKRRVKVPSSTNRSERSIPESVAARPSGGSRGPYHARNVRSGSEEEPVLSRVAIFTDSASDLDPAAAAAEGIGIVPLLVTFGSDTYKSGVDMSTEDFWKRMLAPDAPFPKTAASSPGEFKEAYEAAFAAGADAIVSLHVAGSLSG